ncbi:MAG TPA: hypothetical protein VHT52_18640, partial [Stellaceae bacterium]|nr:hypothetical protein [Stellaceae bacterium]
LNILSLGHHSSGACAINTVGVPIAATHAELMARCSAIESSVPSTNVGANLFLNPLFVNWVITKMSQVSQYTSRAVFKNSSPGKNIKTV